MIYSWSGFCAGLVQQSFLSANNPVQSKLHIDIGKCWVVPRKAHLLGQPSGGPPSCVSLTEHLKRTSSIATKRQLPASNLSKCRSQSVRKRLSKCPIFGRFPKHPIFMTSAPSRCAGHHLPVPQEIRRGVQVQWPHPNGAILQNLVHCGIHPRLKEAEGGCCKGSDQFDRRVLNKSIKV